MSATPDLIFKDISDTYTRENFKRIQDFLAAFPLFRGEWEFFTIDIAAAVTNLKLAHGLGFKPLDVIQTSKTGSGSITFNYDLFDKTNLNITTTGACSVRCFIGAYREESARTGR